MTDVSNAPVDTGERTPSGCPVVDMDFSVPLEVGSYWRIAEEMREQSPVFFNRHEQGYWIFTRYEEVRDIYRRPEIFSSESITPWEPEPVYRFVPTQIDRPDHIKYRRILNPWFSPAAVERASDKAAEICHRLVSQIAPRGECEFIGDFALQYPTEVFLMMIGVDLKYADDFVRWVEDFFRGFGGDPEGVQPMVDALQAIRDFWAAALDERRDEPEPRPGDLASHLLHATYDDERPLTDTERLDMLVVLVLAGLDTTRATLGYVFRHLARHPEHRRQLRADHALIPSFVEEALRYYTIIFGDGRKVAQDTEFHGVSLKKGDMVYGLVSGANRDPRQYEHADSFVIDRTGNNHLGFASGPHRCLGTHLARRELQLAVREWLDQVPDFRLAGDEPLIERGGGAMMSLERLPLAWEAT